MATSIKIEKFRVWLLGKKRVEQEASFCNTLVKDDAFNNGINLSEYNGLTRDEQLLIGLKQYKRCLEYGFPVNVEWLMWLVGSGALGKDVNRGVSGVLLCYFMAQMRCFALFDTICTN